MGRELQGLLVRVFQETVVSLSWTAVNTNEAPLEEPEGLGARARTSGPRRVIIEARVTLGFGALARRLGPQSTKARHQKLEHGSGMVFAGAPSLLACRTKRYECFYYKAKLLFNAREDAGLVLREGRSRTANEHTAQKLEAVSSFRVF